MFLARVVEAPQRLVMEAGQAGVRGNDWLASRKTQTSTRGCDIDNACVGAGAMI